MLIRILRELNSGKIKSKKELAQKICIDESMLDQMLEHLSQMKFIEKVNLQKCTSNCSCCSSKGLCSGFSASFMNMWQLTEKGKNAVLK